MFHWLTRRGMQPRALILIAGFFLIGLPLAGCGGGHENLVKVADNPAPVANVATTVQIASVTQNNNLVEVCYRLYDANNDLIRIIPEYSTNGGLNFFGATQEAVPPSEGTTGLSSSAGGTLHCFVWDPGADSVGVNTPATVRFRVTPNDGVVVGTPGVSDPFVINIPAVVLDIGSTTALFGATNIQLPVVMASNGLQPVRVSFSVSYDEVLILPSVVPAIAGPSATAAGALITSVNTSVMGRVDVTVSGPGIMQSGVIAFLQFDSIIPPVQVNLSTPVDCLGASSSSISLQPLTTVCGLDGDIFLTPNLPPSCGINAPTAGSVFSPATLFFGDLTIDYTLFDAESDLTDVAVAYSTDGGVTFTPATELAGAPSEGTVGLLATPGGTPHIFVWDADTDIPTLFNMAQTQTVIRIVATDVSSGAPCLTGLFTVDLRNAPPVCAPMQLVTMGASGDITVNFSITDVEMDLVDIVFQYSNGGPFLPATASGTSPLPSPALSIPTPAPALTFVWNSSADLGPVMAVVTFRLVAGDAFNPVFPAFGPLVMPCTSVAFAIDNTARVFTSLVPLGPGTALGAGANVVGGGPSALDPCTVDVPAGDFTFSQGVNRGALTQAISFTAGANPLVFDRDGQNKQLVVQGNFAGLGAPMVDLAMQTPGADGMTTYMVNAGPGGPYTMVDAMTGQVTSLLVGGLNGQCGCDIIDVTFTPNGMGTMGGSNGAPMTVSFAACIDYFGWDQNSRDTTGLLAPGDWDANLFGIPSGFPAPGVGGSAEIVIVGKSKPMQDPSAFQFTMTYDPATLTPNVGFGNMGVDICTSPPIYSPWTPISNPTFMPNQWLVNGFRVIAPRMLPTGTTETICQMSFNRVGAGSSIMTTIVEFWSDTMTATIDGTFPYTMCVPPAPTMCYDSPSLSAGFTVP